MTDTPSISTPVQADPASPSPVTSLNAKTARRQKLLLGSLGALALVGGSWFILGGDDGAKSDDPTPTPPSGLARVWTSISCQNRWAPRSR